VLRDQIRYIDSLSGGADPGTKEILGQLPALAAHTLPPDSVVLGVPAAYWYQLDTLRVTARARTLKTRMLVLQGDGTISRPWPTSPCGSGRSPGGATRRSRPTLISIIYL